MTLGEIITLFEINSKGIEAMIPTEQTNEKLNIAEAMAIAGHWNKHGRR